MNAQIIEPNFAHGYHPVQYCWPNARNLMCWDEMDFYSSQHPLLRSVVKLARAKILQALLDLGTQSKKAEYTHWANQAFGWIFSDQSDFRAFCSDAGYSPIVVRRKAKNIMETGLHWRNEAGQGRKYRGAKP